MMSISPPEIPTTCLALVLVLFSKTAAFLLCVTLHPGAQISSTRYSDFFIGSTTRKEGSNTTALPSSKACVASLPESDCPCGTPLLSVTARNRCAPAFCLGTFVTTLVSLLVILAGG